MALSAAGGAVRSRRRVFAPAPAAGGDGDGGEKRLGTKNSRRRLEASPVDALPTCCRRPMSRRVRCAPPVDDREAAAGIAVAAPLGDAREEATIAYIEAHGDLKDKLVVSSERPRVRVRADAMRCLAVPLSRDGPERQITGVLLDAALELLRRRQAGLRRNGRRVLLESVEEQDWLEYVSSSLPRTTAEQDAADMSATAAKYLDHDMVFFPVNHQSHFFVAALDIAGGEYQILDSSNYGRRFGLQFYSAGMSKIRDGVGRCMAAAGRADDVAGYGLRLVTGLPPQTDDSSCGLFAIKCMELWDGEKLARRFTMDDVHALRRKLAEELVFWELNEMEEVKADIESMALARKLMSYSSPVQN